MPSNRITDADVAAFLAGKKRSKKKLKKGSSAADTARAFVEQFHIKNLEDVLRYKKAPITLGWIIKERLRVYDDPKTPASVREGILDKLQNLVLMGAIQDPELLAEIRTVQDSSKKKPKTPDPFAGQPLKFRKKA